MNFQIIEQDTQEKETREYEQLIELYNKGYTTTQIQERIGLTKYKYAKHRREAIKNGRILPKSETKNPKYYYKTRNNKYIISRRNPETNEMHSYGTYSTKEEAEQKVKELIEKNWEDEE